MDGRGQSHAIRTRIRWIDGRGTGHDTPRHRYDRMDTGGRGSIESKRGRAVCATHALVRTGIRCRPDFQIEWEWVDEIDNGCGGRLRFLCLHENRLDPDAQTGIDAG